MNYATIGTSWITDSFIEGANLHSDLQLGAVYSRDIQKGKEFAGKYGCCCVYTDLTAMAQDPTIEAVYIASPNLFHYEHSKLFLQHGKHVLCEKPLAVEPEQVKELTALAQTNQLVYMEAIMMMSQPQHTAIRQAFLELGQIHTARLDYSQLSSKYPALKRGEHPNIFNPKLATGCLMDMGIYCVYPAVEWFGVPEKIVASAGFLSTGADGYINCIFQYADKQVVISSSKVGQSYLGSEIIGDEATLTFDMVSQLTGVVLHKKDGSKQQLVGEITKAELMGEEACTFYRFIKEPVQCREEYLHAQETALNVSYVMKEIRKQAGISF